MNTAFTPFGWSTVRAPRGTIGTGVPSAGSLAAPAVPTGGGTTTFARGAVAGAFANGAMIGGAAACAIPAGPGDATPPGCVGRKTGYPGAVLPTVPAISPARRRS